MCIEKKMFTPTITYNYKYNNKQRYIVDIIRAVCNTSSLLHLFTSRGTRIFFKPFIYCQRVYTTCALRIGYIHVNQSICGRLRSVQGK